MLGFKVFREIHSLAIQIEIPSLSLSLPLSLALEPFLLFGTFFLPRSRRRRPDWLTGKVKKISWLQDRHSFPNSSRRCPTTHLAIGARFGSDNASANAKTEKVYPTDPFVADGVAGRKQTFWI
jgi:hypothetical protein